MKLTASVAQVAPTYTFELNMTHWEAKLFRAILNGATGYEGATAALEGTLQFTDGVRVADIRAFASEGFVAVDRAMIQAGGPQ